MKLTRDYKKKGHCVNDVVMGYNLLFFSSSMADLRLRMGEENMSHMTQGHMHAHHPHHGAHTAHAHAPPLMPSMGVGMQNGHHHNPMAPGHQHDPHEMARKYGIHPKMDDAQFNMTLNLVKSEGLHPHYLYGPLDSAVA